MAIIPALAAIMASMPCHAQNDSLVLMAYNVENLFDCLDDSLKNDDEFLPNSIRAWHPGRLNQKMSNLSRAIINSGKGCVPAIVALCEVENDRIMRHLTAYSPLKQLGYRYVITDSQDQRGINVAIIYQRDKFKLISSSHIRPDVSPAGAAPTRDMLHCSGIVATGDTLDVIACHLPSRRTTVRQSEKARQIVLRRLRQYADSLHAERHSPNIVMMGDFNMEANDKNLAKTFNDGKYEILTAHYADSTDAGSYKYRGMWQTFDHIIVNSAMAQGNARLAAGKATAVNDDYLLEPDTKYFGWKPFRTYNGMKYIGGYSDHLPVVTTIRLNPGR